MNIYGYSERGIVNAFFYDIARSDDASGILDGFFRHITFPFTAARPAFGQAETLIEQSFSDFGEADAVILRRGRDARRCTIFVEAKVKTFQASDWHVSDEFGEFRKAANLSQKVSSSNLFVQLYHKVRFVQALRQGGIPQLQQGVPFPTWSSKPLRRIGNNGVVLAAAERVQQHLGDASYVAIVPDPPDRVAAFLPQLMHSPDPTLDATWDTSTYGFITWSQVRRFCEQAGLQRTVQVFDYNHGQLYQA